MQNSHFTSKKGPALKPLTTGPDQFYHSCERARKRPTNKKQGLFIPTEALKSLEKKVKGSGRPTPK